MLLTEGGQVKYSGVLYPASEPTDAYENEFSAVPEGASRYLVVKVTIPLGTVETELSETRPLDEPANSIIRIALSKWTMTGGLPVLDKILHQGAIQISGVYIP